MDLLPGDVVKHCGDYMLQCDRYYYEKLPEGQIPIGFFFRISVSHGMNSVAVFLCDSNGKLKTPTEEENTAYRQHYTGSRLWSDGRFSFLVHDHDEEDEAIWGMSSYRDHLPRYRAFTLDAPHLLLNFRKELKQTPAEGITELFESAFGRQLDNMTAMLEGAREHPELVSSEDRLKDIGTLARVLLGRIQTINEEDEDEEDEDVVDGVVNEDEDEDVVNEDEDVVDGVDKTN